MSIYNFQWSSTLVHLHYEHDHGPSLARQGVSATLEAVKRLVKAGGHVKSLREPWLETGGEFTNPLLAITGWVGGYCPGE